MDCRLASAMYRLGCKTIIMRESLGEAVMDTLNRQRYLAYSDERGFLRRYRGDLASRD